MSIIAVLIPLSRIFRWYAQLRHIEEGLASTNRQPPALLKELDALDARVERITVPLSHADELYALRSHIALVRARLAALGQQ